MLCLTLAGCAAQPMGEGAAFTADILSTGKSDCILLTMDDLTVLLDTADADDSKKIAEALKSRGIERIDCLILSHFDKDHIGSAAWLIGNYDVGRILAPDYAEDSDEYAALMDAAAEKDIEVEKLRERVTLTTQHAALIVDPPDKVYGDDNNNSLLCEIAYGEHRFLFTGDALKKRLNAFLPESAEHYDFIKLPHHGDDNKALTELLERTTPDYAAETVENASAVESSLSETLSRLGTQLFTTDRGSIRIEASETELSITQ